MKRCGWCEERQSVHNLPDGEGLCETCWKRLRRETAGYPACPACLHRYWLAPIAGWGFKCIGCGTKFAGAVNIDDEEYRAPYRHPFIDHSGLG